MGSAWSRGWANPAGGSFEFNPEYEPDDLKTAIKWAKTAAASTDAPVVAIGVYPEWSKAAFQPLFREEDPLVHQHLIQIPLAILRLPDPRPLERGGLIVRPRTYQLGRQFFSVL